MPSDSRVLIVEDNRNLRLDLSELLQLNGYRVVSAGDGREALASLAEEGVEVVVSDFEMPNMNGHILLETLRSRPGTAAIPFILMSGGDPPSVDHFPGCKFLKKPFVIEDLIELIERLISNQRGNNRQRALD